jgi:ribonuclease HI
MSLVTIIVDASFAPYTTRKGNHPSGWAAFVACEGVKRYFSDEMKVVPRNSTIAEMFAVVNAMHCGITDFMIDNGDKVVIQTDCMAAIERFQNAYSAEDLAKKDKKSASRIQCAQAYARLAIMVSKKQLTVEWRHVRGHTGNADSRFIVQDKCDRKAKYHMSCQHRRWDQEGKDAA